MNVGRPKLAWKRQKRIWYSYLFQIDDAKKEYKAIINDRVNFVIDRKNIKKHQNLKMTIKDSMGIASSMSNIGVVYYEQGSYDSAFAYLKRGLIIEKLIDDKEGVSGSYNNLATYFLQKVITRKQ